MFAAVFLFDRGDEDFVLDIVVDHGLGQELVILRVAGESPQVFL